MLFNEQPKIKKSFHRSRSCKNEKRCKLLNEHKRNNAEFEQLSKRSSKSVTASPHRSINQKFNEIDCDDIKLSFHDFYTPESFSPLQTKHCLTPSPIYNHKLLTCDKSEVSKSSSSSSTIPSPSKRYSPTKKFYTNSNHEHFNSLVKNNNFQYDTLSGTDSNCSRNNENSSIIMNIKSVINRFLDNIRSKNNLGSTYSNSSASSNSSCNSSSISSSSSNNNKSVNYYETNNIFTFKIDNNLDEISTPKSKQSSIPYLIRSTTQQQNRIVQNECLSNVSVIHSSVCTDITNKNYANENRKQERINFCNNLNEDKISYNKLNVVNENIKNITNKSNQLIQAMITRENVTGCKVKRRRQSNSISCCTTHPTYYYHRQLCNNQLKQSQIYNGQHLLNNNNCKHYHNDKNSILSSILHNVNQLKNKRLYTKSISNRNPINLSQETTNHHCTHKHYSPTSFHHPIPFNRMNNSPPFTLKHLSTIRNMYEQNEYLTNVEDKNSHYNEIFNIDDLSQLEYSKEKSSKYSNDHLQFNGSDIILVNKHNHNEYIKHLTEQAFFNKSIMYEDELKIRSNSWSEHLDVHQNSEKDECSSDIESDDEFEQYGSGRPSECEFNIPFYDIKLLKCLQKGERKAIYKGQWHGEVDVHIFEDLNRAERKRFWQDVTRLMMTRHENIALFMGVCVEPPNFAIVTSSCKGVSLFTKLHIKREKFSDTNRLYLLRQIANAIAYLHSRNNPIVIRCLSSKNIFLKPKMNLYLTDYSMEDCDYQVPDHISIPMEGIKYISPELLMIVEKEIVELCENNCQYTLNKSNNINPTVYLPYNNLPVQMHLTELHNTKNYSTSNYKVQTLFHLNDNLTTSSISIMNNVKHSIIFKSLPNLIQTNNNSYYQLLKYSSLPNIYFLKKNVFLTSNDLFKTDKSVKYISPRKASFIKTIRQFISKSEQKKQPIKRIHIPITEFTTYSDIFAFGTIIFELNTRCYPFEELEMCHYIRYMLDGHRDEGNGYCIPNPLRNLMRKCWLGDPTKRPSMKMISQELIESVSSNIHFFEE
ncbi:hypothetical protein MN116_002934 [Schistosoma mekongi]|uniref:Protein kinase domain-containing protein n=1 Tax=Schistosoma mekongi TaxID=38744 RepID=A0AAE1ZH77_SCHME|nr:hypothetical protein MN116_002934 [Schistosoma mekongi]